MLPTFDEYGNLPAGIHVVDEATFFAAFGMGTARRAWLAGRLRQILALARVTGKLERLYVWGSFVTAKEHPKDLDLFLLMRSDFDLERLPEECRMIFDHRQAKGLFQADVFWSRASIDKEVLALWLDTYQITRDHHRRGIIELRLS
jgi:hypothetical protein